MMMYRDSRNAEVLLEIDFNMSRCTADLASVLLKLWAYWVNHAFRRSAGL